jgi:hypothetical protein
MKNPTKTCAKCKETKSVKDFYTTSFGTPASYCHQCRIIIGRNWRVTHLEQSRELVRNASKKYRIKYLHSYDKYVKNNPEKRYAKEVIHDLTRHGKLTRKPCEVCGENKVHAHHPDYSKPREVIWLCPVHHKEEHRRIKLLVNKHKVYEFKN